MTVNKLFKIHPSVTPNNFAVVMQQAIALELATIPTYLCTYYSIERALDQDVLYDKILGQLNKEASDVENGPMAQELKVDVLVYANKSAALIMSVVIEEMLHLALASNVKQAIIGPPDLMGIGKVLSFPTMLDGHKPEFPINAAKLSLDQLSTFLQIESPAPFVDPADTAETDQSVIKYPTIGAFYDMIIECVTTNYPGPYTQKPQLLPPEEAAPPRPYYSQNSINTVYYDKKHNPVFASADDSGELVGVRDAASAIKAMHVIQDQGEGNVTDNQDLLKFDSNNMPIPLPVVNGEVQFKPGDYDDIEKKELSHFAKFLEAYSLGVYYKEKFAAIPGLDEFFSYFVSNQISNPKQAYYDAGTTPSDKELALISQLGNAIFAYILLMIETCYYKDEPTQFRVFMYGIHKSMIWLLSDIGNAMRGYNYQALDGNTYVASLTFEHYDFSTSMDRPKKQIIDLANKLIHSNGKDSSNAWGWLVESTDNGVTNNKQYLSSLPDVGLDHSVTPNVPSIPA
jgi:hypothetical protein